MREPIAREHAHVAPMGEGRYPHALRLLGTVCHQMRDDTNRCGEAMTVERA